MTLKLTQSWPLTRTMQGGRITAAPDVRIESSQVGRLMWRGGWAGQGEGGETPGGRQGRGLGQQTVVHLNLPSQFTDQITGFSVIDLPALVDFCSAAVPAGGPAAVGDPDQVGAAVSVYSSPQFAPYSCRCIALRAYQNIS